MLFKISLILMFVELVIGGESNNNDLCNQPPEVLAKNKIDGTSCCQGAPKIFGPESTIIKKCEELFLKDLESKPMNGAFDMFSPEMQCFSECMLNETEILKDNQLQIDMAKKIFVEGLNDGNKEWTPTVLNAVAECETKARQASTNTIKQVKDVMCTDFSRLYLGCFDTELFRNCPKSNWISNEKCQSLKAKTEKCPKVFYTIWL